MRPLAWNVSPQVVLVTFQKEQSLLSKRGPSGARLRGRWAAASSMVAGRCPGTTASATRSGTGPRSHKTPSVGSPGVSLAIDGNKLKPSNASTHGLYKYTPHIRGNMSFWMIFWRYFGDPLGGAPAASTES